jgi:hypothetical protein
VAVGNAGHPGEQRRSAVVRPADHADRHELGPHQQPPVGLASLLEALPLEQHRLALMSCRLATIETEPPGIRASSTIRRFCSAGADLARPLFIPSLPWCPPSQWWTPSRAPRTGTQDRTLTVNPDL